ncbi:unnamed protein product [Pleuronectes platessa]|uniref:Uncharacterized protein n=1 Tax=Pleuronectes platessa TaxID=8262 RepID=A0A9N7UJ01_PLEPL|nr:unnamed protein product [Pleuronectes platessa]
MRGLRLGDKGHLAPGREGVNRPEVVLIPPVSLPSSWPLQLQCRAPMMARPGDTKQDWELLPETSPPAPFPPAHSCYKLSTCLRHSSSMSEGESSVEVSYSSLKAALRDSSAWVQLHCRS